MMNRTDIREILFQLRNISSECDGLFLEEVEQLENMLEEEKYKVVVIGEFSTGKSTFLNALMGRETLFSSLRESTGVVTYVEHGPKQMAYVYYENQEVKSFFLRDENDVLELKKYVDRKSKDTKPAYVSITTPELQFDEEVAFIDTPGLQGIGGTELEITKEAIKEANATIVLTTEKGFSGSELEVISGRNMKFGKIRTKDIFVVINQIGKVYENRNKDGADQKVARIINEVKGALDKEGLSTIPVFAIDSRDYLWSKDDALYESVKQRSEGSTTSIYDQDFYRERSRFEGFKDYLVHFLSSDQRNINFIEDITEKIYYIIEAFEEEFSQQEMQDERQKSKQLDILKSQRELILQNRKKLYNSLIRAISQSIDTYKDKMEEELKRTLQIQHKEIVPLVDQYFPDKKSLSNQNMTLLNKKVSEILQVQKGETEQQLGDYFHTLTNYLVDKTWAEAFQKIFKHETNVKMKLKTAKVTIDMKWEDVKYEEEEKVIRDLKTQQGDIEADIRQLEKNKQKLEKELYVESYLKLENKRSEIENKYNREKARLGKRPEPVQKYKTVKKKRTVFLFFKETYYDDVPDGLDYGPCRQWDKKQEALKNQYFRDVNEIEHEITKWEDKKRNVSKLSRQIQYKQDTLAELEEEITLQRGHIERKKEQQEKYFLNEKKMQLVRKFRKVSSEHFGKMQEQIWDKLYDLEKQVKEELKQEIDEAIAKYEEELSQKISHIATNIQLSSSRIDAILNALTKLKGEMGYEL